jgi:hypothetical protein
MAFLPLTAGTWYSAIFYPYLEEDLAVGGGTVCNLVGTPWIHLWSKQTSW